jgi:hypothetical protein
MIFQIHSIEFDFSSDDDDFPSQSLQQEIIKETLETLWETDDEEELVDDISDVYGWCVKTIDYTQYKPA